MTPGIAAPGTGTSVDVWVRFTRDKDPRAREEILAAHAPLVRHIVGRMKAALAAAADRDDLESAGAIGLIKALERFDPSRNVKFDTFAYRWIQGSVLDYLRQLDPLTRGGRRRVETYRAAVVALRDRLGRDPTDNELRHEMRLSAEEMRSLQWEVSHADAVSFDAGGDDEDDPRGNALVLDDGGPDVLSALERRETIAQLRSAIEGLPEKERLVVSLYYQEELTLKEIGEVLGVSESRVCQIHTRAVKAMQGRLMSAGGGR